MRKSKIGAGHRERQRENWATEDLKGRHVQQCSKTGVKNNHKTGENRVHSHNDREHSHNTLTQYAHTIDYTHTTIEYTNTTTEYTKTTIENTQK